MLSCTLSGCSGPSALPPPLGPCAEIVPGPFEIIRPNSMENSNSSSVVGFLPIRARNAASVNVHFARSSLLSTPQNFPFSCFSDMTLHPMNAENILEYHGRLIIVAFDIFFLIRAFQPRVIQMAARSASADGFPFEASFTKFMNTDLLPSFSACASIVPARLSSFAAFNASACPGLSPLRISA